MRVLRSRTTSSESWPTQDGSSSSSPTGAPGSTGVSCDAIAPRTVVASECRRSSRLPLIVVAVAALCAGCASLGSLAGVVRPPRFTQDGDRPAEIRLVSPSLDQPLGGAGVRIWAKVLNPNPFGFTLSTVKGTLLLEGTRAATGDFPLGLPLAAGQESVVPLDLAISFADLPGLATVIKRAATGQTLAYQFDGTLGVDAGRLGQPTFGPMMLMQGELRVVTR